MKIVIPLAGFGKRLRPHTFTKPKPLINVASVRRTFMICSRCSEKSKG